MARLLTAGIFLLLFSQTAAAKTNQQKIAFLPWMLSPDAYNTGKNIRQFNQSLRNSIVADIQKESGAGLINPKKADLYYTKQLKNRPVHTWDLNQTSRDLKAEVVIYGEAAYRKGKPFRFSSWVFFGKSGQTHKVESTAENHDAMLHEISTGITAVLTEQNNSQPADSAEKNSPARSTEQPFSKRYRLTIGFGLAGAAIGALPALIFASAFDSSEPLEYGVYGALIFGLAGLSSGLVVDSFWDHSQDEMTGVSPVKHDHTATTVLGGIGAATGAISTFFLAATIWHETAGEIVLSSVAATLGAVALTIPMAWLGHIVDRAIFSKLSGRDTEFNYAITPGLPSSEDRRQTRRELRANFGWRYTIPEQGPVI